MIIPWVGGTEESHPHLSSYHGITLVPLPSSPPLISSYHDRAVVGAAGNVLLLLVKAQLVHPSRVELNASDLKRRRMQRLIQADFDRIDHGLLWSHQGCHAPNA